MFTDETVTAAARALWAHTTKDNRQPEPWDEAGPQEQEEVRQAVRLVLECAAQPVLDDERLVEQFAQAMWDYLDDDDPLEEDEEGKGWWPAWADAPKGEREDTKEAARRLLRLLGPILLEQAGGR